MTDKKYIIALDQGTTSSRAVLLDHNANVVEIPNDSARLLTRAFLCLEFRHASGDARQRYSGSIECAISIYRN